MMNSVSVQIQRAISDAISTQVLPQIQNVIMAGSGHGTRKGWDVPSERPELNSEVQRNPNAKGGLRKGQDETLLEDSLLPKSTSSTSSAEFSLFATLLVKQPRSELVLDKLSTLDDKFSISFRISRWFNSVSLRRFEILFSILLEMSSKSLSDNRVFSSLVELATSSSIWLVDWSLLSFRF